MPTHEPQAWYQPLLDRLGRATRTAAARNLADLHRRRRKHLGQIFTPLSLAQRMWRCVQQVFCHCDGSRPIPVMDNAVGSGRLWAFADFERVALFGADVDGELIAELDQILTDAGAQATLRVGSMTELNVQHMAAAVINPPFSLQLDSPHAQATPASAYGRYGPASSCLSQCYAVYQALSAATLVVAVLPRGTAASIVAAGHDLVASVPVPPALWWEEGACVQTEIAVWLDRAYAPEQASPVTTFESLELLLQHLGPVPLPRPQPVFRCRSIDDTVPVITTPYSGHPQVTIGRRRDRLVLTFRCGAMEALCRNALARSLICSDGGASHHPAYRFTGDAVFAIEQHLSEGDPVRSIATWLIQPLIDQGAVPHWCAEARGYLQRRIREHHRQQTPFRRWVLDAAAGGCATCRESHLHGDGWDAPLIEAGESGSVTEVVVDGEELVAFHSTEGQVRHYSPARFDQWFDRPVASDAQWRLAEPGRAVHFPAETQVLRRQAEALGITAWLRPYQLDDVIELLLARRGVSAHDVGLGKTRIAVALCLLSGSGPHLCVIPAHLVDEWQIELRSLDLPPTAWQVIERSDQVDTLRCINIIAETKLRSHRHLATTAQPRMRMTYAGALRRRIRCLVVDEGHMLARRGSLRSRAVVHVSAKRHYLMTATPMASYERDVLAPLQWVAGDATAVQPFGHRRPSLVPGALADSGRAFRGTDLFRDRHMTLEWISNEYRDTLEDGARRPVPRLRNVQAFRRYSAPHILRRVATEPEVAAYIRIPTWSGTVHTLDWDDHHLATYIEVAQRFRSWYLDEVRRQGADARRVSLLVILRRIQVLLRALSLPSSLRHREHGVVPMDPGYLTPQERKAIDLIRSWNAEHKTILLSHSPQLAERLADQVNATGISAMVYHGQISPRQRARRLQRQFRQGTTRVLCATIGSCQSGLNLHQASRVVLLDRSWSGTVEHQAIGRVLRPQQQHHVEVHYLHLAGSLSEYQAQLVEAKQCEARVGIDWSDEDDDVPFEHFDTILGRMLEDLGIDPYEFFNDRRTRRRA